MTSRRRARPQWRRSASTTTRTSSRRPGLYEQIFYDELECESPRVVSELLCERLDATGRDCSELNVFDVGAGNGMVGEQLESLGVPSIVGVDIIEAAAAATERDRPGIYDDYLVLDLADIPPAVQHELESRRFNCMTSVAALGFGDIPPEALAAAYNIVEPGTLVAFTIKRRRGLRPRSPRRARLALLPKCPLPVGRAVRTRSASRGWKQPPSRS